MLDWKILAASFAALLVVSSVLVGGFGFTDLLNDLKEWIGETPFEGFISLPIDSGSKEAAVTLYPDSFSLDVTGSDFTANGAEFSGFTGTVAANLENGTVELSQSGSDFAVRMDLTRLVIGSVVIDQLTLEDMSFSVESNSLDTSGDNATLEILGFSGTVTLTRASVELSGNFSSVKGNGKVIV